jgi:hypothetical protein
MQQESAERRALIARQTGHVLQFLVSESPTSCLESLELRVNGDALGWKDVLTDHCIVGQVCNWKSRNLQMIRMVSSFADMKNVVLVTNGGLAFFSHHVAATGKRTVWL